MIQELAPQYGHKPSNIPIEIIGTKPGEKMYEELMNIEETRRSWELQRYFVVLPAYGCIYQKKEYKYDGILKEFVSNPYNSSTETPLSKHQLIEFLKTNNLLEEDPADGRHPAERFWPNGECEL
jgi:FlaA1/EpsC-like NDP-sugar epimerase